MVRSLRRSTDTSHLGNTAERTRLQRWTDTPHLVTYIGATAVLAIVALVFALHLSQVQTQRLQGVVCDTFTDIGTAPITPSTTELGRRLVRDTAHGAKVADCPGAQNLPAAPLESP